jgi:hypothetical protein
MERLSQERLGAAVADLAHAAQIRRRRGPGAQRRRITAVHGGYGFMNEYRVARAGRDARVTKIWAGSDEIMKELIGRDLGLCRPVSQGRRGGEPEKVGPRGFPGRLHGYIASTPPSRPTPRRAAGACP